MRRREHAQGSVGLSLSGLKQKATKETNMKSILIKSFTGAYLIKKENASIQSNTGCEERKIPDGTGGMR